MSGTLAFSSFLIGFEMPTGVTWILLEHTKV